MIKFNKEPKLDSTEKEYVVETLKPLLKQNKILKARAILNETDAVNRVNIIDFLLYHLQDAYFKDSNEIFEYEFYCSNMVHINIPSNITDIYEAAFMKCKQLEGVSIPDGVTKIAQDTFLKCKNLKNIVISQTVTQIEPQAFFGCSSLTKVYIPDNVEWIDSGAFEDCINLKRVSIPGSCDFDKDTFYKGVEIIRR
jgi:hypothetical protein